MIQSHDLHTHLILRGVRTGTLPRTCVHNSSGKWCVFLLPLLLITLIGGFINEIFPQSKV